MVMMEALHMPPALIKLPLDPADTAVSRMQVATPQSPGHVTTTAEAAAQRTNSSTMGAMTAARHRALLFQAATGEPRRHHPMILMRAHLTAQAGPVLVAVPTVHHSMGTILSSINMVTTKGASSMPGLTNNRTVAGDADLRRCVECNPVQCSLLPTLFISCRGHFLDLIWWSTHCAL